MKAENDGGVISVEVGGKQDDRLVSALTVFPVPSKGNDKEGAGCGAECGGRRAM